MLQLYLSLHLLHLINLFSFPLEAYGVPLLDECLLYHPYLILHSLLFLYSFVHHLIMSAQLSTDIEH